MAYYFLRMFAHFVNYEYIVNYLPGVGDASTKAGLAWRTSKAGARRR